MLRILHNPRYAGAFTFGRHRDIRLPGGKLSRTVLPREEWIAFIPGAHPGYITLDQYEANRARSRRRPGRADRAAAHRHPHPAHRRGCPHRPGRAQAPGRGGRRAARRAHVERARQHADLARHRYLAVDLTNRLVADTLEADWNTALRALSQAQDTYGQARQNNTVQLTDAQKPGSASWSPTCPRSGTTPPPQPGNASASPGCCLFADAQNGPGRTLGHPVPTRNRNHLP